MLEVANLEAFGAVLADIETNASDDADLRRRLNGVRLSGSANVLRTLDPFSRDYRDEVLAQFSRLKSVGYNAATEGLDIDIAHELRWGFPYGTQSAGTIGAYLIAIGHIIAQLNLPAGSRIIEMGCGTGSLTRHLMASGYEVIALDINASNTALIKAMGAHAPKSPQVYTHSFDEFAWPAGDVDAVIFFESFHHSLGHADLLAKAATWIKPGGRLAFCAEPIVKADSLWVPYPWGLRTDGESLRAIAKWGWLELGFQESYFFELLKRAGLSWTRAQNLGSHWADVILATRH